jgi:hypothetical protein
MGRERRATLWADCGLSLQARAIHPAGSGADIQATPNWAWRCTVTSLLRAGFVDCVDAPTNRHRNVLAQPASTDFALTVPAE